MSKPPRVGRRSSSTSLAMVSGTTTWSPTSPSIPPWISGSSPDFMGHLRLRMALSGGRTSPTRARSCESCRDRIRPRRPSLRSISPRPTKMASPSKGMGPAVWTWTATGRLDTAGQRPSRQLRPPQVPGAPQRAHRDGSPVPRRLDLLPRPASAVPGRHGSGQRRRGLLRLGGPIQYAGSGRQRAHKHRKYF